MRQGLAAMGMLGLALWAAGCAPEAAPGAATPATVLAGVLRPQGTEPVPEGAQVSVTLRETAGPNRLGRSIAETRFAAPGGPSPMTFRLPVAPALVQPGRFYALAARITVDGALGWSNTERVTVDPRRSQGGLAVPLVHHAARLPVARAAAPAAPLPPVPEPDVPAPEAPQPLAPETFAAVTPQAAAPASPPPPSPPPSPPAGIPSAALTAPPPQDATRPRPLQDESDWGHMLPVLLPGVQACLAARPGTVLRAWPLPNGRAGARILAEDGTRHDCLADRLTRRVERITEAPASRMPGEGRPVFLPGVNAESDPCRAAAPVRGPDGARIGSLVWDRCG